MVAALPDLGLGAADGVGQAEEEMVGVVAGVRLGKEQVPRVVVHQVLGGTSDQGYTLPGFADTVLADANLRYLDSPVKPWNDVSKVHHFFGTDAHEHL